jgi:hypothetical protein
MTTYFIAWWNLENLFDVHNSINRPERLKKQLKSELKGWTQSVLNRKISQLTRIIGLMNDGKGPDILGVCEVENKPVIDHLVAGLALPGRSYQVAHHDTSDNRGIDVAFIYDNKKFTFEKDFFHVILKRNSTRDLYQVNLLAESGKRLVLIGNHWPARSAGVLESEPYRILAAETMAYWNERILEIYGKDVAVIAVGDFNDQPFDRSVMEYALTTNVESKVRSARSPVMLNLMWHLLAEGKGTHFYGSDITILDQFMVSKGIVTGKSGFSLVKAADGTLSASIEMFDEMRTSSRKAAPKRFGRPSASLNRDGYSDHYPVSLLVKEK